MSWNMIWPTVTGRPRRDTGVRVGRGLAGKPTESAAADGGANPGGCQDDGCV